MLWQCLSLNDKCTACCLSESVKRGRIWNIETLFSNSKIWLDSLLALSYTLFICYCYCQSYRRLRRTLVSGVSVLIPYYRGLCQGPPSLACLQRTNGSEPSMLLPAACPLALHTYRHTAHRHDTGTTQSRIVQHWHGTARTSSVFRHRARVPPGCHQGASHRNLHNTGWLELILVSGMILIFGRRKGDLYDTQNSLSRKPYAKSRPFQSCFC